MSRFKWIVKNKKLYRLDRSGEPILIKKYNFAQRVSSEFAIVMSNGHYGCIDSNGTVIIPLKYDLIKTLKQPRKSMQFVCGRGGNFFEGLDSSDYRAIKKEFEGVYTGIYDLYDCQGALLFGGFDECKYDRRTQMYLFLFGREWSLYPSVDESFPAKFSKSDSSGNWIILDDNFGYPFDINGRYHEEKGTVVCPVKVSMTKIGRRYYPTSFIKDITDRKPAYTQTSLMLDLPGEAIFDTVEVISDNIIRVKKDKSFACIFLKQRKITPYFDFILSIDNEYAIALNNKSIGLVRDGKLVIPCSYEYITRPENDWVFAFKTYPHFPNSPYENKMYGRLIDLNNGWLGYDYAMEHHLLAFENLPTETIDDLFVEGALRIHPIDSTKSTLSSIALQYKGIVKYINDQIKQKIGSFIRLGKICDEQYTEEYYWCVDDLDRLANPSRYQRIVYEEDNSSILDALDGDIRAFWNID